MASTKTRVRCGKRFWKVLLLHLPTYAVSIINIICGKHRKIVEQIQVCIYRMLVHRQRHRCDIHMTSTTLIKYKNGVHFAGMRLFFCISSEVKIMIQNVWMSDKKALLIPLLRCTRICLNKNKSALTKMWVRMWWFCGVIIFCSNTWTNMILNYDVVYTWLISMKKLQNVKKPIIFCSDLL